MTLEENVLKIIDKLKSLDGTMLGIQKRLLRLEAQLEIYNDRIQKLEKRQSPPFDTYLAHNERSEQRFKALEKANQSVEKRLKKLEEEDHFKKEVAEELAHRLSKLEPNLSDALSRIIHLEDRLGDLIEKEETPCFESEGGFVPNKKFLSWYTGSFAPSEDDPKDILEEVTEETQEVEEEVLEDETLQNVVDEVEYVTVSAEVLEKLKEVTKDG